jgi:hypothetical protein
MEGMVFAEFLERVGTRSSSAAEQIGAADLLAKAVRAATGLCACPLRAARVPQMVPAQARFEPSMCGAP